MSSNRISEVDGLEAQGKLEDLWLNDNQVGRPEECRGAFRRSIDLLDRSPWLVTASGSGLSYLWPTSIAPALILDLDPKLGGAGRGAQAGGRHTDHDLLGEQPGGEPGSAWADGTVTRTRGSQTFGNYSDLGQR